MSIASTLTDPLQSDAAAPGAAYSLEGGRCAADAVLVAGGIALWRARLDVMQARLVTGHSGSLVAEARVRPGFASVPFSRRRFLAGLPSRTVIRLTVPELPELGMDEVAFADGTATAGDRTWSMLFAIRVVAHDVDEADDADRIVLAVGGRIVRDENAPLTVHHMQIDVAAELIRCD